MQGSVDVDIRDGGKVPPSSAALIASTIQLHIEQGLWDRAQEVLDRARSLAATCEPESTSLDQSLGELMPHEQRIVNHLERAGIFTVRELLQRRRSDLARIENFGPSSIETVYRALAKLRFYRRDGEDE